MTNRTIPYTSEDLRAIADKLDEIIEPIMKDAGDMSDDAYDWRWGLTVEVFDPEVSDYTVGYIKPHSDGWLGFYPTEVPE